MTSFMFKNGNRRIARLVIYRLGAGMLIMVFSAVLGNLPAQDWLSPRALKITSFVLGTLLTAVKAAEMFFDKTATMFKNHEIPDDTEPPTTQNTQ